MLSGKVYQWNQEKREAHRLVGVGLDRHVRLSQTDPLHPIKLRNALYSYWLAGSTVLFHPDGDLSKYNDQLMMRNACDLRRLVCIFHCCHVVTTYLSTENDSVVIYIRMMQALGKMYDQDQEYLDSWVEAADYDAPGDFRLRTMYKLQREVAPILGSSPDSVFDVLFWNEVAATVALVGRKMHDNVNWDKIVTEEISAILSG